MFLDARYFYRYQLPLWRGQKARLNREQSAGKNVALRVKLNIHAKIYGDLFGPGIHRQRIKLRPSLPDRPESGRLQKDTCRAVEYNEFNQ